MKNRYLVIICIVSVLSVIVGITACNEDKITDVSVSGSTFGSESQTDVNGDFVPIETSSTATTYVDPNTGETVEVISTLPDGTPDETQPTGTSGSANRESGTNPTTQTAGGTKSPDPTRAPGATVTPTRAPGTTATPTPTRAPGATATPTPFAFPTSGVTVTPTPKPTATPKPTNTPVPTVDAGSGTFDSSKAASVLSLLNDARCQRAYNQHKSHYYELRMTSSMQTVVQKSCKLYATSGSSDRGYEAVFSGKASASTIANEFKDSCYRNLTGTSQGYLAAGVAVYYVNNKTYCVVYIESQITQASSGLKSTGWSGGTVTNTPTPVPTATNTPTPTPKPTATPTPKPTNTPTPKPTNTPTPKPTEPPETQSDDTEGDE